MSVIIYLIPYIIITLCLFNKHSSDASLCVEATNISFVRHFKSYSQNTMNDYTYEDNSMIPHFNYLKNISNIEPNNYIYHKKNNIIKNPYNYQNIRTIHKTNYYTPIRTTLKNDSLNMLFILNQSQNNFHKKKTSFLQLGTQYLLSEKIISLGIGKRNTYINRHGIGYNIFYNLPVTHYSQQSHYININGEYWYGDILFSINNCYKIPHLIFPYLSTSINNNQWNYPKFGCQICAQAPLPYFIKCSGQLKLTHFLYPHNKTDNTIFRIPTNNFNKNSILEFNINYQPIPILGFSINNIMINKKYHINYQLCLNYQFHIPISQQINYDNKYTKYCKQFDDTNIVEPFIFQKYKNHNYYYKTQSSFNYNHYHHNTNRKIIGYPGEVKLVKIDHHDNESVSWNDQVLQDYGGKIINLNNKIYAIYLPTNTQYHNNQMIIQCYITKKHNSKIHFPSHKIQSISIHLKYFPEKNTENTQINRIEPLTDNKNYPIIYHNLTLTENNDKNNTSVIPQQQQDQFIITPEILQSDDNDDDDNNNDNISFPPPPPPLTLGTPSSLSSLSLHSSLSSEIPMNPNVTSEHYIQSNTRITDNTTQQQKTLPTTIISFKNELSYIVKKNDDDNPEENITLLSQDDNRPVPIHDINNSPIITIPSTHNAQQFTLPESQISQINRKRNKFSLIGTQEHIDKLNNITSNRNKNIHSTEITKILSRVQKMLESSSNDEEDSNTNSSNSDFN